MNNTKAFIDACELLAADAADDVDINANIDYPERHNDSLMHRPKKRTLTRRNILIVAAIILMLTIGIVLATNSSDKPTISIKRFGATIDFYLANPKHNSSYKYFGEEIIPNTYRVDNSVKLAGYEYHVRLLNNDNQYADLCVIDENSHTEIPINNNELKTKRIESQKYYYVSGDSFNYIVWTDGQHLLQCTGNMPIEELFDIIILF